MTADERPTATQVEDATAEVLARLRAALAPRYIFERQLGAGGMGIVWLVRDTRHNREVALKALRPELGNAVGAERFLREIHTTARFVHPHILPLYDSGEADGLLFYTMPYVTGESLRERITRAGALPIPDAIRITCDVADALAYAHTRGVIHRDIKPENILLTADGDVLVADFGLARVLFSAANAALTRSGIVVGSPAYMSPEQAGSKPGADARSDIYSLACVLFEMLTGKAPFVGASVQELMLLHLTAEPPRLREYRTDVPPAIARALARGLAKRPHDRFPNVAEFRSAIMQGSGTFGTLRPSRLPSVRYMIGGLAAALVSIALAVYGVRSGFLQRLRATDSPRSIAVLPFENLSTDAHSAYFVEGVTEDISAKLSKIPGLRVISRNSTSLYKGTQKSLSQIGRELNVAVVLQGSIRREANKLRITVHLDDTRSDQSLWADTYDKEFKDVFEIQAEIAQSVADALRAKLSGAQESSLRKPQTGSLTAYDYYLRGREYSRSNRIEERQLALDLFRRAIQLDPRYALPYSGIAQVFLKRTLATGELVWVDSAKLYAGRALVINPVLQDAHRDLATAYGIQGNQNAQLQAMRTMVGIDPNTFDALRLAAGLNYYDGKLDQALRSYKKALALEPTGARIYAEIGAIYFDLGMFNEARQWCNQALEIKPDEARARQILVYTGLLAGDIGDAEKQARFIVDHSSGQPADKWWFAEVLIRKGDFLQALNYIPDFSEFGDIHAGYVYLKLNRRTEALKSLAQVEAIWKKGASRGGGGGHYEFDLAKLYAVRGENDKALAWLGKAIKDGWVFDRFELSGPYFNGLRPDPRFVALLAPLYARAEAARQTVLREQL